jgi:asparagine synthase (glutamine-hydrolysing)
MCGIAGFNWEDKALIGAMADAIVHRGPDQYGFFCDSDVSIANRRLSIIDLSERGRQPISNEEGTVHIVYNGELYNYLDLKPKLAKHRFKSDTDTEVILHAYEEFGFDCLKMFNGDFAFAIYDSKKKILFLARDHTGVKPLYYYAEGGKFIFSSELKSIILEPSVKRVVNRMALSYLMAFRFVPWQDSIIEGIKKLAPGSYMVYDLAAKKLEVRPYWDAAISEENQNEEFFATRIRSLLVDSVKRRLMSDVPLGVYLSGGVDSGSILSAVARIRKEHGDTGAIKTFSVGFGYGELTDEVSYAKRVSEYFSTDHHEFIIKPDIVAELPKIIWAGDEPISDTAHVPFYYLAKNAKKHVTVVLSGEGGDELFAGYEHYKFVPLLSKLSRFGSLASVPASLAMKAAPDFLLNRYFKYASALGEEGKNRFLNALNAKNPQDRYLEIVSIFNAAERKDALKSDPSDVSGRLQPYFSGKGLLNNMLYLEYKTVLPESYLMKGDKMNMISSVEARVPILDSRIVECAFSIPQGMKLKGSTEKYIFKKAMKGYVPDFVLQRKKQRFYVPIDKWIGELKPVYEELLSQQNIERQGYFKYDYIRKILDRHNSSPLFYSRQLWTLLTFGIWHRLFIENVPLSELKL